MSYIADDTGERLLYRKIQAHLEQQLRRGMLKPNEKIPGERTLSEQLNVSRGTVRAALSELEKADFLVRVPTKGTFIRDGAAARELNFAYIFPEPEISLKYQRYGNYVANAEIWRGIIAGCAALEATGSFIPAQSYAAAEYNRQLADRLMRSFSGAIFPSQEFFGVADLLDAAGFPCIFTSLQPGYRSVACDSVKSSTLAAQHLLKNGCRSVKLIGIDGPDKSTWNIKVEVFRREFAAAGYWIPDENLVKLKQDDDRIRENLAAALPENVPLPDAFFSATPLVAFALLHLAAERRWRVPEETQIIGYANDMNVRSTVPALTHIRLPHAAIGARAVEHLGAYVRSGVEIPETTLLEAEFVQGETTRK